MWLSNYRFDDLRSNWDHLPQLGLNLEGARVSISRSRFLLEKSQRQLEGSRRAMSPCVLQDKANVMGSLIKRYL